MALPPPRAPIKPRRKSVPGDTSSGSKWVGYNWEALSEATDSNGGQVPYSISLVTSDFPNKHIWSEDNLPTILFFLTPPTSQYEGRPIRTTVRDDGKPLRSFHVLPDRISINVQGWLIEAWRRLDPRISYEDILERMTPDPQFCQGKGLTVPTKNSLQMHTLRSCRKLLGYWQLEGLKDEPSRAMVEALEKLRPYNLLYNTVLPICPKDPNRLLKLRFERKFDDGQFRAVPHVVTADNIKDVTLPINFFRQHLPHGESAISVSVDRAWETLLILQERADIHGLSHWSKLHKNCRPLSWQTRTKGAIPSNRPDDDKNGDDRTRARIDTYDGGCETCTWRPKSQVADQEKSSHSSKRHRVEESDEEPVSRRMRTESSGINLISSGTTANNAVVRSSSDTYLSARDNDHHGGRYLPQPSTPPRIPRIRTLNSSPMYTMNSSPPGSYSGAALLATQAVIHSGHTRHGMTKSSRFTPVLPPLSRLTKNLPEFLNMNSTPTVMQNHQARPWNMPQQLSQPHDELPYPTPSLVHSLSDHSYRTTMKVPSGFAQSLPNISTDPGPEQRPVSQLHHWPREQSWQPLSNVQYRTMNLQHALGNPYGQELERRHTFEASLDQSISRHDLFEQGAPQHGIAHHGLPQYRHHEYSLPKQEAHIPSPKLVESKRYRPYERPARLEPVQDCGLVVADSTSPQEPYQPQLPSHNGPMDLSESSQDELPMPNMDWDDEIFRIMLHSDDARLPEPDVLEALALLPDGATVGELASPLHIHETKHYPVKHDDYHQFSHAESAAYPGFLNQSRAD